MSGLTRRLAFVGFCLLPLGSGTQLHAQGASLSSTSLIFGNQAIATSSAKSVRLTNTGTAPLLITYLTQPSTPFSENDNCPRSPASLAPKAFCTISVTFSPTAPGAFSSAIKIADNASDSPQIISLKGTGVPQATLSPTPLTFGSVGVGSTSTAETATLQNNLNTSLSITSIVASGDFAIPSNKCGSSVPAGGQCQIAVTFTPSQLGIRSGSLTVRDSANNSPQTVSLEGVGTFAGLISISVTPANVSIITGSTEQFTATGKFPTGILLNLTKLVYWSSSPSNVATFSNPLASPGLATGKAAGTTTITSTSLNGISGSASLTVTAGGKTNQTITFTGTRANAAYGTSFTVSASASSGLLVTITASGVCTLSGSTVTMTSGTGTCTLTASQAGNATYNAAPNVTNTVSALPATATLTLSNLAQTYDGTAKSATVTTSPAGLTVVSVTYNGSATLPVNAVSYAVVASLSNANYAASNASGTLVISKANATVTANAASKTYGAIDPALSASETGFTATDAGTITLSATRAAGENAGTYTITPAASGAALANYNVTYTPALFTINKLTAMVTANAASKTYGSDDPVLSASETGFTAADAGTITLSATRAVGENVGTYTITPAASGAALANYNITYNIANFTISHAAPVFSVSASQTIPYGTASIALSGTISAGSAFPSSGETVSITINGSTVAATIGSNGSFSTNFLTSTISAAATPYGIAYSYAGNINFASATDTSTSLTVNQAALTLVSITVAPSNSSIAIGSTQQFAATGIYSDSSTKDLTTAATWTSLAARVATVSNLTGSQGLATTVSLGVTTIAATFSGVQGSTNFAVTGTGTFVPTGNMQTARDPFTATLLPDGTVLIAGGFDSNFNAINSAELYDSAGQASSPVIATMQSPRADHTATLLNNGKVLIEGGYFSFGSPSPTAELYDPKTQTFALTAGSPNTSRAQHTATLLLDGTVLIAGGIDGTGAPTTSAELYDPRTDRFTAISAMGVARYGHTATLLNDGTVLIAGGATDNTPTPTATAEIYNPVTWSFASTNGMNTPRAFHTATLLNDETVLIVGGVTDNLWTPTLAAELFLSSTSGFSNISRGMTIARATHTATLLNDGTVLISGGAVDNKGNIPPIGNPTAAEELYDPNAGGFSPTGSLATARSQHTATLLTNGAVLIAGGSIDSNGTTTNTSELYQPAAFTPPFLQSVVVTPATSTVAVGVAQRFVATGTFNIYGSLYLHPLASVIWSSTDFSGTNVAQISNDATSQGVAQAISPGTATITASAGTIIAGATLTTAALNSILVTPASPTIPAGTKQQFTATGSLAGNATEDLTAQVSWSSSPTGVATINSSGLASGLTQGSSAVTATFGSVTSTVTLTVGPPALVSIAAVTLVNPIQIGGTAQFTAIGTYTDGSMQDLSTTATPPTWSSSLTGVAMVTATGLANGIYFGQTTITATVGVLSGSTILYVTNVVPSSNSMNVPRANHRAVLLDNGQVLLTGGISSSVGLVAEVTAELFNPASGAFGYTGSMTVRRQSHSATVLNNGKVLIAGGRYDSGGILNILSSAEIYDPSPGIFTSTGGLNEARDVHTATLLNDGTVLITGGHYFAGSSEVILASAEIYSPSTGTFSRTTTPMSTPRINHTATLLNNGKVLIAGGLYLSGGVPTFLNTAELYDPATGGTFIPTTNTMQVARDGHTATLLQDGTVLIVGGDPSGGTSTEIYDPVSNTFVPNSPAATTPGGATATLLDNGMALLTSVGSTSNGTALYDPAAKTFTATGNLNAGRSLDTATLLNNGSVLLTGGIAIPGPASSILVLASAELYPPSTLPPDTPSPANLVSIAVTPQSATLVPGATLQFTAKGTFNINGVMSMQQLSAVTWSSTDVSGTNVAQITNDVTNRGAVLAVAVGTATIKACAGTICGSTNLTVQ